MNRLERIQRSLTKKTVPMFEIGDTVRVHVKVVEGEKERIQVYEGTVIARKGTLNTKRSPFGSCRTMSAWKEFFPSILPMWPKSTSFVRASASSQALLSAVEEGEIRQGRRSGV